MYAEFGRRMVDDLPGDRPAELRTSAATTLELAQAPGPAPMTAGRSVRALIDLSVAPPGGAGTYAAGLMAGLVDADIVDRDQLVVVVDEQWAAHHPEPVAARGERASSWSRSPSRLRAPGGRGCCAVGFSGSPRSATASMWPSSPGRWRLAPAARTCCWPTTSMPGRPSRRRWPSEAGSPRSPSARWPAAVHAARGPCWR